MSMDFAFKYGLKETGGIDSEAIARETTGFLPL